MASSLRSQLAQLKKACKDIRPKIERAVKEATQEALTAAEYATPPKPGQRRGTDVITGELKSHWEGIIKYAGKSITVTLANDKQYASYVDQGHRLVKHFVPWLYVDGQGLISRHKPMPGETVFGLMVGTKTSYIEGYKMTEQAVDRFQEAFTALIESAMREIQTKLDKI